MIEVERIINDLEKENWGFTLVDKTLVLAHYRYLARATKRHGFKAIKFYSGWDRRVSTVGVGDVPLPEDVAQEAKQKLFDMVKVVKRR